MPGTNPAEGQSFNGPLEAHLMGDRNTLSQKGII